MPKNSVIAKTATEGLRILWKEKFFEKSRKMEIL